MTSAPLSEHELGKVEAWMATAEFKARVEKARERFLAGEPFDFPALAKELDLPLDIVLAHFAQTVERRFGGQIAPVGRLH